ncbi:hypothetical protein BP6252_11089 [Coleophoma cylindrospora]|uniref:AMP-dependent synthetase/ligase domain-containing protein n=1 Tax=Coleophoma cylindrospora TaxID=1849047 RepID=A0A3D8QQ00_9HELO|nr:hypothetical protein BP6252_11089 [Coleophoma cylindrospora]
MERTHGATLPVHLIDSHAQHRPNDVAIRYAEPDWENNGYRSVTWKQYADAVNKTAFWLDQKLGKSTTPSPETFAYWGPNDLRYAFLMNAAMKTNRALLIPDGRVSSQGLADLFAQSDCGVFITTEDNTPTAKMHGLPIVSIPSLEYFLDSQETPSYPFLKTFEEVKYDRVVVIHTSGTTGSPKPIFLTTGWFCTMDSFRVISQNHQPRGIIFDDVIGSCLLSCCPPQWIAGLFAMTVTPLFLDCCTVLLPADMTHPLDLSKTMKIITENKVTLVFTPPHLIEELYQLPEGLSLLKSLDSLCYAGAALDKTTGDNLCEFTNVRPFLGSTEAGPSPSLNPVDPRNWNSFDFVPEIGPRFEKVTDELYELHFDRDPPNQYNIFQGAFHTFPDRNTHATSELYTPVIDADGKTRWVLTCRKDDLTKLSWLAKFHAADIEKTITKHPAVQAVFVGGNGREVPFVIIQPVGELEKLTVEEQRKMVDEIYDSVVGQAIEDDIVEVKIPRQTVMLADPTRPFQRTLKMTLKRAEIEQDYKRDIDEMYQIWTAQKA